MRFEWDENKRQENLKRHGIDFLAAIEAFNGPLITQEDNRFEYDEERFTTLGLFHGDVIVVIHSYTSENAIRIISVRKANKHEQKIFYTQIGN